MPVLRAGQAILWAGAGADRHLWLVLTDPDPETAQVVMVMVVTQRQHTDKTVTLASGDHPFIRHDSNIDYGSARPFPSAKIQAALKSGAAKIQPEMTPELLEKVCAGVLLSSRTIHAVSDYCRPKFEGRPTTPGGASSGDKPS